MIQRPFLAGLLGISLLAFSACDKKVKLETDMQKASYAIGQQLGQNFKGQNIEVDPDVLAASLKDVLEGKEAKMKPDEMQAAIQKLQENMRKKSTEEGEKNKKDGLAFLDKNKSEKDVKTTSSGLQYIVMKEGEGKSPALTDSVVAHYKGTLIDGKEFDSSYTRGQPAEFPVSGVIKGWTEALQMMKKGGKMKLFIPPDLAYGEIPRPGIPANSVLVFEVELMDIKTAAATPAKKAGKATK